MSSDKTCQMCLLGLDVSHPDKSIVLSDVQLLNMDFVLARLDVSHSDKSMVFSDEQKSNM